MAPEAVDVGRRAELAPGAGGLLGGHVAGRAQDRAADRQRAVLTGPLGQAEVGDVRASLAVEQDVRGLQVAVQEAALVGVVDGAGQGSHQPGGGLGVVARFLLSSSR